MPDPTTPLGLPAAFARRVGTAPVISTVEQTRGGDTLITFGEMAILPSGNLGQIREHGTVRLVGIEREELIARLTEHRVADLSI